MRRCVCLNINHLYLGGWVSLCHALSFILIITVSFRLGIDKPDKASWTAIKKLMKLLKMQVLFQIKTTFLYLIVKSVISLACACFVRRQTTYRDTTANLRECR